MSLPYPGSNGIRSWLAQPSHSTSWLSLGAFQFYAVVWVVYIGMHWLFHALGGLMQ